MLSNIEAKNFKAFGEKGVNLDLSPLTIILGPNNSGKTSLLESIALLAQTAPSYALQQTHFKWRGPWVDFGPSGQFAFHNKNESLQMRLGVTISHDEQDFLDWLKDERIPPRSDLLFKTLGYRVGYTRYSEEWVHELNVNGNLVAINESLRTPGAFGNWNYQSFLRFFGMAELEDIHYFAETSNASVLSSQLYKPTSPAAGGALEAAPQALGQRLALYVSYFRDFLRTKAFLVSADRGLSNAIPALTAQDKETHEMAVGKHGEFTFQVLSRLFASPDFSDAYERIRYWARIFGLANLKSGWAGENALQVGYQDSDSKTGLQLQYAGYGSQQLLPLITQVFCAPAASLIMIEEPEISLHPAAQVELVKMFAEAVENGKQILLTTHSPTFLMALPQAAKEHRLSPTQVAIYHITRPTNGEPTVTRLEIDERWLLKGWVPSFSEIESRLMKTWIETVHDDIAKEP